MSWYDIEIRDVIQETPMDRSFVFGVPEDAGGDFRWTPGQYVSVRDMEMEEPMVRAYSISSSPTDGDTFQVTVRDVGSFGDRFFNFSPGKHLQATAPRGGFLLRVEPGQHLVLAGGGSGVTPYRAFTRYLRASGHTDPVHVVVSSRLPDQLIFEEEFRRHEAECDWFGYVPTVTRCEADTVWDGRRGRIDADLIREIAPDLGRTVLYACGPNPFVDAMLETAADLGVPPDHLRREKWG